VRPLLAAGVIAAISMSTPRGLLAQASVPYWSAYPKVLITIQTRDKVGNAIPQVDVAIIPLGTVTTDTSGRASLSAPLGQYDINAYKFYENGQPGWVGTGRFNVYMANQPAVQIVMDHGPTLMCGPCIGPAGPESPTAEPAVSDTLPYESLAPLPFPLKTRRVSNSRFWKPW